jgi:uncharacterized protein YndB with AHSA1/START domain/DNA-binding transcriptional ArsR family regulator
MLKQSASLDRMFQALADPSRRSMVDRLTEGPASLGELAAPLAMSLAAAAQHLKVLEASGLVSTEKVGRLRICRVERLALAMAEHWIVERMLWEHRFGRLERLLDREERRMAERSIAHGSFTVKRNYPHPVAKVFHAWADPAIKRQWYGGDQQDDTRRVFDFQTGGRETSAGVAPTGEQYSFEIRYYDIIDGERIVYTYDVHIDGNLQSVSLATVSFVPSASGTELVMTEHGAFLDGSEAPEDRIGGTEFVLDRLSEYLNTHN